MKHARLLLAAAAAAPLVLAACGGGGDDGGPVTLRMTTWSANEDHLAMLNEIADAYIADHPEVEAIEFDPLPFEGYTSTLTTQIAGDNAPDLAWILENAAPDFVSSGALVPLSETLAETEGYEYDDLVPAATELWRQDDELYAYPFSTSPFGMFVNTDLLAEAGQPAPAELIADGQWTWERAVEAGAAVHAATGTDGIVIRDFDYTGWDNLSTLWTGWGASAWSADGAECGFDDPEMVEALTFMHDAVFEHQAMPGPGTTADFFAGEAAMTVTQISRAGLLADAPFAWDLVPLPAGPTGEYAVIGQAGLGVLTVAPHPEEAADFLAYMTNPENSAKLAQYFPPPRASQLTAEVLGQANPLLTPEQLQTVVIDQIDSGVVKPSHTGQAQLDQAVRAALDPLWTADADVAGVLTELCTAIDPLLAR
ncbi:sugar ABC transporter substrate-binding protein [Glycomyces sp. TRM65418]|uniref:ABC transporter substrate-binding protein n=1 Tax=Glycomyces sp. TRM65418 TaxID=2867006 RepID=UPI001CE61FF0|nr:sugar ABC transporter substrate-binding protein [Glycomyces sp. TRM65418]MCC3765842.1 sugar ABC transporter substrate-binding protein [Glycomyces sp. TRM65418]QZD55428.1 sugar ABC transporter substrate-binding protein [Glycomyces sp. TRM65418]